MYAQLEEDSFAPNETTMSIYWDLAYFLKFHLQQRYMNVRSTQQQEDFNIAMSKVTNFQ